MPRRLSFMFVDASPAHTQKDKELIKAQASAHAARMTHTKKKLARLSREQSLEQCQVVQPLGAFSIPSGMNTDDRMLPLNDSRYLGISQHSEIDLALQTCDGCRCRKPSTHGLHSDNFFQLICQCSRQAALENFRALFHSPAHRPDWAQEDVVDLHFFIEILGNSIRNFSDGGFFNIVVPCLSEFDFGIRNLVLAISSTYRNILAPKEIDRRVAYIQALKRYNKAIKSLSKRPALASPEVLQTSCVLLVCWHMLRLDPKAAETCTRAAAKLCYMDGRMTLSYRIISARNATDPQENENYRRSTFASIIAGTVAKRLLDFPVDFEALVRGDVQRLVQLNLSSAWLRYQIRDTHDLLSSLECLSPIYQQLRANITFQAHIEPNSSLVQDLLARIDRIAAELYTAPTYDERIATAIEVLWSWNTLYFIGVQCQLVSSSEMSWDNYTTEFAAITSWAERHLLQRRLQTDSSFLFLPVGIIVKPLWFTAVHCRDPTIRRQAITSLLNHHRNEMGMDSWLAGHVAKELMDLEEGKIDVHNASDINERDRVLLRGFKYMDEQLYLLFVYATEVGMPDDIALRHHPFSIPRDPHGVVQLRDPNTEAEYLHALVLSITQAMPKTGPKGYLVPIYYDGELVEVVFAANGDR